MAATSAPGTTSIASDPLATRARTVDNNQYYVATLHQPDTGLYFRAFVPETFNISIQNHWEPIFGAADGTASPVNRVAAAVGSPINVKYFSRQIWTGTEPLDFQFTFHLDAYGNTRNDVEKPIIDLLKMATPVREGIFLKSPGPTLISDSKRIYLRIGKFFVLDSVIIKNVDITFYTVADRSNGAYMSADLNVHVSSAYTPDQADILNYFSRGQSGDNSLDPANRVPDAIRQVEQTVAPYINRAYNDLTNSLSSPSGVANQLFGIPGLTK